MLTGDSQNFGGPWTEKKLNIFEKYLNAYVVALKNQLFSIVYIDAFAGTGVIHPKDSEVVLDGSAKIALSSNPKFDKYYFIEKDEKKLLELQDMVKTEYPELASRVVCLRGDANDNLSKIINTIDWNRTRGLLFVDPFATQFNWSSLVNVAKTCAIDVWYLFPFSAVNRMLTRDGEIVDSWRRNLDRVLGCDDWFDAFYKVDPQISLFTEDEEQEHYNKNINTESLKKYIIKRLEEVFPAVAPDSRMFYNSQNAPLFLFCFAVSNRNKQAQVLAMRIAGDILKRSK